VAYFLGHPVYITQQVQSINQSVNQSKIRTAGNVNDTPAKKDI